MEHQQKGKVGWLMSEKEGLAAAQGLGGCEEGKRKEKRREKESEGEKSEKLFDSDLFGLRKMRWLDLISSSIPPLLLFVLSSLLPFPLQFIYVLRGIIIIPLIFVDILMEKKNYFIVFV